MLGPQVDEVIAHAIGGGNILQKSAQRAHRGKMRQTFAVRRGAVRVLVHVVGAGVPGTDRVDGDERRQSCEARRALAQCWQALLRPAFVHALEALDDDGLEDGHVAADEIADDDALSTGNLGQLFENAKFGIDDLVGHVPRSRARPAKATSLDSFLDGVKKSYSKEAVGASSGRSRVFRHASGSHAIERLDAG